MTNQTDPDYLLVETSREVERLRNQHAWFQLCLDNKIIFAPVNLGAPDLKVLDVGCADGSLLRDLRKGLSPSAQLVGLDVMSTFLPPSPEGNIRYVTGDICEAPEKDLAGAFGLTHVRFVLPGCGRAGVDQVVSNLAATLAPGGWLQVHEWDVISPRTAEKSAFNDFMAVVGGLFDKGGIGANFTKKLEESFQKAGLENVTFQRVKLPAGRHLENETDAKFSMNSLKVTIPTFVGAAKAMGAEVPSSAFEDLEERFEREMMGTGATFISVVVCGQKPL